MSEAAPPSPTHERARVIGEALAHFEAATRASAGPTLDLTIAKRRVRLRFAGEALAERLVPALAHRVGPPSGHADLTVHLWDRASTGIGMSRAPWSPRELLPGGRVAEAQALGLEVQCQLDSGLVTILDLTAGVATLWIDDAACISRHEAAAPLRQLFASWFPTQSLCMTHAAAVGWRGRGVLLGGASGSGKSTTALLCLDAGLELAGDDYVLVDPGEGGADPTVHGLYATAKVDAPGVARLPNLVAAFDASPYPPGPEDKAIAFLHRHAPERAGRDLALVALLLPVVTGLGETRLEPMSGARALRALAPSTVFQHGGDGRHTLAMLAGLVARLPCFRLALGTDFERIPELIRDLVITGGPTS